MARGEKLCHEPEGCWEGLPGGMSHEPAQALNPIDPCLSSMTVFLVNSVNYTYPSIFPLILPSPIINYARKDNTPGNIYVDPHFLYPSMFSSILPSPIINHPCKDSLPRNININPHFLHLSREMLFGEKSISSLLVHISANNYPLHLGKDMHSQERATVIPEVAVPGEGLTPKTATQFLSFLSEKGDLTPICIVGRLFEHVIMSLLSSPHPPFFPNTAHLSFLLPYHNFWVAMGKMWVRSPNFDPRRTHTALIINLGPEKR